MKIVRPPSCTPVQDKFRSARGELSAALVERDDEVDLLLTALVAGGHALLVGPPGTPRAHCSTALRGGWPAAGSPPS